MGDLRKVLLPMRLPQPENSRIFHEIVESGILEALARRDLPFVEAALRRILPAEVNFIPIIQKIG
jgi:hypothetical protein